MKDSLKKQVMLLLIFLLAVSIFFVGCGKNTVSSTGTSATTATSANSAANPISQTGNIYVGYYPTWSDNWFSATIWDGTKKSDEVIKGESKLARTPKYFTHVMLSFAYPDLTFNGTDLEGTGLNFSAGVNDIKESIRILRSQGQKVILAIGGATFNGRWAALAAEVGKSISQTGTPHKWALVQLINTLGLDGLDVDFEEGVEHVSDGQFTTLTTRYYNSIVAMREAVDASNASNGAKLLTLAGWSTGADCTAQTASDTYCANNSFWGDNAGRERIVLKQMGANKYIDVIAVMSYDAQTNHYDPLIAYQGYRDIARSGIPIAIGIEPAPEGWAGGMLVVNNTDANCAGSKILANQYQTAAPDGAVYGSNGTAYYSAERFANYVKTQNNGKDGIMIWSIFKPSSGMCGSVAVATPTTASQKVQSILGLTADLTNID